MLKCKLIKQWSTLENDQQVTVEISPRLYEVALGLADRTFIAVRLSDLRAAQTRLGNTIARTHTHCHGQLNYLRDTTILIIKELQESVDLSKHTVAELHDTISKLTLEMQALRRPQIFELIRVLEARREDAEEALQRQELLVDTLFQANEELLQTHVQGREAGRGSSLGPQLERTDVTYASMDEHPGLEVTRVAGSDRSSDQILASQNEQPITVAGEGSGDLDITFEELHLAK